MLTTVFSQVRIGETHRIAKTISESDVYMYAGIVGDFHPNHVNAVYADEKLGGRVAHGALLTGFVSRCTVELIGERLTPPGYVAQIFNIKCVSPVFLGDTITVIVTISEIDIERRKVIMDVKIENQRGQTCAVGETVIKVLREPAAAS